MKINYKPPTTSAGFTLIEVLVALLIVALGMLGNAMLQLQGMKNSNDAYIRSQVGIIAFEIADKIRANRECQGEYVDDAEFFGQTYTVGTSNAGDCIYTGALGSAGMPNERACIGKLLEDSLPAGTEVSMESNSITPGSSSRAITLFLLNILWTDRDGEVHSVDYTFDPGACVNSTACSCT